MDAEQIWQPLVHKSDDTAILDVRVQANNSPLAQFSTGRQVKLGGSFVNLSQPNLHIDLDLASTR